ncbi:hypothetical protein R3P38DRAFT_2756798 [Favolaschia claudopus]|uniref:Reverse transcriptase n=1 Tax=Favolaschia claudopus TaxID=2862362 RepID=A0AAW0EHK4_9AGAR
MFASLRRLCDTAREGPPRVAITKSVLWIAYLDDILASTGRSAWLSRLYLSWRIRVFVPNFRAILQHFVATIRAVTIRWCNNPDFCGKYYASRVRVSRWCSLSRVLNVPVFMAFKVNAAVEQLFAALSAVWVSSGPIPCNRNHHRPLDITRQHSTIYLGTERPYGSRTLLNAQILWDVSFLTSVSGARTRRKVHKDANITHSLAVGASQIPARYSTPKCAAILGSGFLETGRRREKTTIKRTA